MCAVLLAGAVAAASAQDWQAPRTAWGDPDFDGIWISANTVGLPFQRLQQPASDGELLRELVDSGALEYGLIGEGVPQEARLEHRRLELSSWRSSNFGWGSLVIDPADGRLPPLVAGARERAAAAWRSSVLTTGPWDSAASLGPVERCISRGALRSMLPAYDYNAMQFVQAPGTIVIRIEAIHEARIIPLDDRPPLSPAVQGYMGNARGRWDGDTLVVETANFNGRTGAHLNGNEGPTTDALRLLERFTRVDEETIEYHVTVTDPGTWLAPWTVMSQLTRDDGYPLMEYACHEGNYALRHILSAARFAEASR